MLISDGFLRKAESLKPIFQKLKEKGVKIRIAAPLTKECIEAAKDLKGLAEIRHSDKLKARFVIVDSKEATFMPLDDAVVHPTYDVGVWLNTEFFANALESMFESSWKDMKPV